MDVQVTLHVDEKGLFETVCECVSSDPTSVWAQVGIDVDRNVLRVDEIDVTADDDSNVFAPRKIVVVKSYELTPEKIVSGLGALLDHGLPPHAEMRYYALLVASADMSAMDADLCDCILQMSCFNEVRYG